MKSIILTIALAFTTHVIAKTPDEFCVEFFETLQKKETSKAYDGLFKGSPIVAAKPQAVQMLKSQTDSGLSLYGSILGYEPLLSEEFGKSLIRKTYMLKTEMAPLVWEFYFYKPKDEWSLYNVFFNDELKLLESKK